MQLIGMLDSPFVRRVAITAQMLGIPFEHRPLSVFRNYDDIRAINPLVKVPTLVCDDGEVLIDSTLIIDYLESACAGGKSLMPDSGSDRVRALQIVGTALAVMEKTVAIIVECRQRPEERQHEPWIARIDQQLRGGLDKLESWAGDGANWLLGTDITQADISLAVAWRFVQHVEAVRIAAADYPGLCRFSVRAEALPAFAACPLD